MTTLLYLLMRRDRVTERGLAREIGCNVGTVARWVRGEHSPLPVYVKALEERFGVPIDQLLAEVAVNA